MKIEIFFQVEMMTVDLTLDRRASNIFLTTNSCLLGGQDCDLFRGFSQLKKKQPENSKKSKRRKQSSNISEKRYFYKASVKERLWIRDEGNSYTASIHILSLALKYV